MIFARLQCSLVLVVSLALLPWSASANSSDLEKETSIAMIPEDADLYSTSLRLAEQWNRFLKSKAVDEFVNSPLFARATEQFQEALNGDREELAPLKAALKTPLAKDILHLLQEMASEEVFFFADSKYSKFLIGLTEFSETMEQDGFEGLKKEDIDAIPIPNVVVGFKFKDDDRALTLLDQLQAVVSLGLQADPSLAIIKEGFDRVEDARGTRLVLTLEADMIPWNQFGMQDEGSEGIINEVKSWLEGRKVTFTLGTLDRYIILALSEDAKQIARLGKLQANSLLSNPHMKPLLADRDKNITSISYQSDALNSAIFQVQWKGFFSKMYRQYEPILMLSMEDYDLPPYLDSLELDLEWLDDEMDALVPDFKGNMGYSYESPQGWDGFYYGRTESVFLDGNKPLEIASHLGDSPLLVWACRHRFDSRWLTLSRKIFRKLKGYVEQYVLETELEESDAEDFEILTKKGWPLLKRLADCFEQKLQPATQNGQVAFIVEQGSMESHQWIKDMVHSEKPLALPELALVLGISDKNKFVEGCTEIYGIFDSLVDIVRELSPEAAPEGYSIPRPEKKTEAGMDVYYYAIPDDCPVPKDLAPQILIDDDLSVATYSEKQAKKLVRSSKVAGLQELLRDSKRVASVSYFNMGATFKMLEPWLQYTLESTQGDLESFLVEPEENRPGIQGKDVVDLWKALSRLGSISASTEVESNGSTKTHWTYRE